MLIKSKKSKYLRQDMQNKRSEIHDSKYRNKIIKRQGV